jgi:hypothetical protein
VHRCRCWFRRRWGRRGAWSPNGGLGLGSLPRRQKYSCQLKTKIILVRIVPLSGGVNVFLLTTNISWIKEYKGFY